jgi:nucleotide-binding universal stress UspA family protein
LVLLAAVEMFLGNEIALREEVGGERYLVFPSQYMKVSPYPGMESYGVAYDFEGAVRNIFTTLVVRLAHAKDFKSKKFYKDAATYTVGDGQICIVKLDENTGEGRGRLTVFFEGDVAEDIQRLFLQYVYTHIQRHAVDGRVVRRRAYHCPKEDCGYLMDEKVVEERLRKGEKEIVCPRCDTRSELYELIFGEDEKTSEGIRGIDEDARAGKLRQLAETRIKAKKRLGKYDIFLSYASGDREAVISVAEALKDLGVSAWMDVWDLVPGQPWQEQLERAVEDIPCAAVFMGPSGQGPWQEREIRAYINRFVGHEAKSVMPVLLPGVAEEPGLPTFLSEFQWVDMRGFSAENREPLRNLLAGILGRRMGELAER